MKEILIPGEEYLDAPDIDVSREDVVRVAGARHVDDSRIVLWRIENGQAREEWVSDPQEGLFTVRLVHPPGAGPLVCAWCCVPGASRVVVLDPRSGERIVHEGLAEPCPVVDGSGRPVIAARAGERIVLARPRRPDDLVLVSEPGGRVFGPCAAPLAGGGILVAWEQERVPGCGIMAREYDPAGNPGPCLWIDGDDTTSHAPCVAPWPAGGALVAWHGPAGFVRPQPLVKDLRLALVTDGEVLHPSAGHGPDAGDEPRGEEQGFEFPVPVPLDGGPVLLLGRGSHCYYWQVLDGSGWRARDRLDDLAWGCRGPAIRAGRESGGRVWAVTRERGGLAVRPLDTALWEGGGKPAFGRAGVRCTGGRAEILRAGERVQRDRDGLATWFGDIHQHCAFSDGTGAPHETYVRARDLYCDDLVALTDHESFLGKRTPPGEWHFLQDLAGRFDDPGAFATLIGYEWTGKMAPGPGHKVIYYASVGRPLVSRDEPSGSTGAGLLEAIAPHGGIAVPHHVGWTGADEESHRPDLQPCFEIVSCHGAYEKSDDDAIGHRDPVRGPFIFDLLRRGLRFGFCGGSDGHGLLYHHGVSRKRDSHRTGLTAVISRDLEAASIMEALHARRVYATSGERMWLRLWVDGKPMGSEIAAGSSSVGVVVEVSAGGLLRRAALVLPRREVSLECRGDEVQWSGEVEVDPPGPSFLYLRVVRRDGECGWSSPVFLV